MKLFKRKPKPRVLQVGDKMPPDVDLPEGHNMGGFVSVCPCCRRIDAIFHP